MSERGTPGARSSSSSSDQRETRRLVGPAHARAPDTSRVARTLREAAMLKYVFRRVLLLVPTVIGTSLLIFVMLRLLPGDVVDALAGTDSSLSVQQRQALREALGLADPIPVQYLKW